MFFVIRKFGDSQTSPACPSDKGNYKVKTSKEHWLIRLLVAGLLSRMKGFESRPVHVRFVGDKSASCGFRPTTSVLHLSVSLHQCSMLIPSLILTLSEGQTGEV